MALYNNGSLYNAGAENGGFNYNGKDYVREIRVSDGFDIGDACNVLAVIYMAEPFTIEEKISSLVRAAIKDYFLTVDDVSRRASLSIPDDFEIDEEYQVRASLKSFEIIDLLDTVMQLCDLSLDDGVTADDLAQIFATIKESDSLKLAELLQLNTRNEIFDTANVIDKEPSTAESDIYIAKDPDGIYDILLPFGLIINWADTDIPFMPQATDDAVKLAGLDGEVINGTVYEPREFNVSAVTFTGLTPYEKEEIKAHIARVLHSIKHKTATLTIGERETSFDVKYTGLAESKDYAGWVRFDLPLKAPYPLGRREFAKIIKGAGLLTNEGDDPCGFEMTITGPCSNPEFVIGDKRFAFTLSLGRSDTLVIDTNRELCKVVSGGAVKNAVPQMTAGDLALKIPVGSLALQVSGNLADKITTVYQEVVVY